MSKKLPKAWGKGPMRIHDAEIYCYLPYLIKSININKILIILNKE